MDLLARLVGVGKNRLVKPLLLLCLILSAAFAELPPSAYESMQANAHEALQIQVLRIDVEPGEKDSAQDIVIMATVEKVVRTASGLKPGDVITIAYTLEDRPPGWVGPGQVPLLAQGDSRVAYLKKLEKPETYAPAAGAMSFDNF